MPTIEEETSAFHKKIEAMEKKLQKDRPRHCESEVDHDGHCGYINGAHVYCELNHCCNDEGLCVESPKEHGDTCLISANHDYSHGMCPNGTAFKTPSAHEEGGKYHFMEGETIIARRDFQTTSEKESHLIVKGSLLVVNNIDEKGDINVVPLEEGEVIVWDEKNWIAKEEIHRNVEKFEAPELIHVKGRTGFNSGINGVYYKQFDLHHGRVFYATAHKNLFFFWHKKAKFWVIGSDLGTAHYYCVIKENIQHPVLKEGPMLCYDGASMDIPDPKVKLFTEVDEREADQLNVEVMPNPITFKTLQGKWKNSHGHEFEVHENIVFYKDGHSEEITETETSFQLGHWNLYKNSGACLWYLGVSVVHWERNEKPDTKTNPVETKSESEPEPATKSKPTTVSEPATESEPATKSEPTNVFETLSRSKPATEYKSPIESARGLENVAESGPTMESKLTHPLTEAEAEFEKRRNQIKMIKHTLSILEFAQEVRLNEHRKN